LGILSEAAHSALDLVAAVVTFFSVRVSDKPADADHQYGHGKVENFSAFIETGLLLLTCIWIIYEAIKRLFFHSVEIQPSITAVLVMIFSIGVDYWRSHRLAKIAAKYDSQALEADALHFSTDIWSSSVVILGLLLVWTGEKYQIQWLQKADPIAALFVAGVVGELASRTENDRCFAGRSAVRYSGRGSRFDLYCRWDRQYRPCTYSSSREPLFRGRIRRNGAQRHLSASRADR
jgi:cation diffusion facilitator family transporter